MTPVRVLIHLRWDFQYGQDIIAGLQSFGNQSHFDPVVVRVEQPIDEAHFREINPRVVIGDSYRRDTIDRAHAHSTPFIDVTGSHPNDSVHEVLPDDEAIAAMAMRSFRQNGLTAFAFSGFDGQGYSEQRRRAFVSLVGSDSCASHTSSLSAGLLGQSDRSMDDFLRSLPVPCGLFACNDLRALGILEAAKRIGRKVPRELQVIGVDVDQVLRNMSGRQVSSVDQGAWFVGWQAADLALKCIRGQVAERQRLRIAPLRLVGQGTASLQPSGDAQLIHFRDQLDQHLHQPTALQDALDVVHLSRRALELRMRRFYGCSPLEYLHRRRLEHALKRIAEPDVPFHLVASEISFSQQGDFSRFIKKHLGVTPTLLRRRFTGAE